MNEEGLSLITVSTSCHRQLCHDDFLVRFLRRFGGKSFRCPLARESRGRRLLRSHIHRPHFGSPSEPDSQVLKPFCFPHILQVRTPGIPLFSPVPPQQSLFKLSVPTVTEERSKEEERNGYGLFDLNFVFAPPSLLFIVTCPR